MQSLRFSIVTLSYNQSRFLPDCLASVTGQVYPDLQYIVVDPGSTDGSRELLAQHRDAIDHLILEPDAGPADGLNKGFAAADGDIFGYVNADDRLLPGTLKRVAALFREQPDTDVLTGAIRIIDADGRPGLRKRTSDLFDPRRYVAGICTVNQQATFFRREAFVRAGGFNPDNRIAWDGELLLDMALAGCRFRTVDRLLGDFRVYPGTITDGATYRDRLAQDIARQARKLESSGVSCHPSWQVPILRLGYKADLLRHLRYFTVS